MAMSWRHLIVGSPLRTAEQVHQRLTKAKALAIFSSDALSSVAYATEEILFVLVAASTAALNLSMPIALTITGLLVIVAMSYYQTIHGYPSGGGSYIVAHENLGVWPGLVAAAALLIDYVLTVAVSITAGIVAIRIPAMVPTIKKAATASAPMPSCLKKRPTTIGIPMMSRPGSTICFNAPAVTMSTHCR